MTTLTIAELTIRETQRRRILWVALIMGIAFLAVFGIGFHYIMLELEREISLAEEMEIPINVLMTAGLYVVNFLIIMMAVLTSVTAVSGEIDNHTIETIVTKPVRRWEIILGKWLGFAALLVLYVLLMAGGLILIVYLRSGVSIQNIPAGMSLMLLQGLTILSLSIAGGTRLSTLANGVLAFMLYGIAFIGGWVEQVGAVLRNETAVDIGIVASLIMPGEILWKKALSLFQPAFTSSFVTGGPFAVTNQPSNLMIGYAIFYLLALLLLALWSFTRRDL